MSSIVLLFPCPVLRVPTIMALGTWFSGPDTAPLVLLYMSVLTDEPNSLEPRLQGGRIFCKLTFFTFLNYYFSSMLKIMRNIRNFMLKVVGEVPYSYRLGPTWAHQLHQNLAPFLIFLRFLMTHDPEWCFKFVIKKFSLLLVYGKATCLWAPDALWPLRLLGSWALRLLGSRGSRLLGSRLLGSWLLGSRGSRLLGSWAPLLEHSLYMHLSPSSSTVSMWINLPT